jgi:transposase InsO family protein
VQQQSQHILDDLDKDDYEYKSIGGTQVVCRRHRNGSWRIVLPGNLIGDVLEWYHITLCHPGATRMKDTIGAIFTAPNLAKSIELYVERCDSCQRHKDPGRAYVELPPREAESNPFEEVAVDLIGPWTLETKEHGDFEFSALTATCTACTLCELARVEHKTTDHVTIIFENVWLSRYPKPTRVVFDHGGEFTGATFQSLLLTQQIKPCPTTAKNPMANAIAERSHKTIGAMIRSQLQDVTISDVHHARLLVDSILASTSYALRSTVHRTLGATPGSIVFGRDMMLNIPIVADWELMKQRRQLQIDIDAAAANAKRHDKEYQAGDEVLLIKENPKKLEARAFGPFTVIDRHLNGTITIERQPGVFERISVRRVKPYKR